MNIFLDDERNPKDVFWIKLPDIEWAIARNYIEFRDLIWNVGIPDVISYDHDLGEEKNGLDCCKFLVNHCNHQSKKHPDFYVHSQNLIGKQNIISYISSYHKTLKCYNI